ncbi:MAG: regulatory iron-sulfur-containing complex subunit RicT [Anaerolineae bacterium]|jgi:cell fate regulator YaaT (PSP1 superfamily)
MGVPYRESTLSDLSDHLIAGVRFQPSGKIYYFDASRLEDLRPGDFAVVETVRGTQLGEVVTVRPPREDEDVRTLKPIRQRATGRELALRQQWQEQEKRALELARQEAEKLNLPIKVVLAEYTMDGNRLTVLYSSEDKHVDVNGLERRLQGELETRVELLKIGPRDQAKLMGGCGACGGPRCCSHFLPEFTSISIKMAKKQGVSLHPSAITGMCDRLRCCLDYEYEQYLEALRDLPRRKRRVKTPYGEGRVIDLVPLKHAVVVIIEDRRVELPVEEIEPISN